MRKAILILTSASAALIGVAHATPVVDRGSIKGVQNVDECKKAKQENTEVAQAEGKTTGDEKAKHPAFEPMYLAF